MSTAVTKHRADFTEGSIIGSMLKMGLPSMFGFLVQHLYAMADMFWVSRLPQAEAGVAAITFFTNLMWMLFAFNQLIGPGSVAVISRRYGEKDFDRTETAIKEAFLLKLLFGALLGIVGLIFMPQMLTLLGARGDAYTLGISYGRVMIVALPILYATYTVFTALRSIAHPNWAMGLMIGSNVLNIVLDPLLMFGWGPLPAWGIVGAAVASVVSYSLTLSVGLAMFYADRFHIRLHRRGKVPISLKSMWKIVRIGVPAWLGDLSFSGSRLVITPIVAGFGTGVVAAYGVSTQLFGFGIMVLVGMGLGLSSLIGHNIGSAKLDRAKRTADRSILFGIGVMSSLAILTFLGASIYMKIFFDNAETINYGVEMLLIMALGFPFFGAYIMLENIHVGVGLNTPYMVFSIIHSWGFQVLPALIVSQLLGLSQVAVWWVLTISGVVTTGLFYLYYLRGRWLTVKV